MKVIIAGSRGISDAATVRAQISKILTWLHIKPSQIVSGAAKGVDTIGESYASMMNIPLTQMPADWNKHGKAAGPIRNKAMAEYADIAIVFWDGTSPGTKNMIDNMSKLNKVCIVHTIT